MAYSIGDVTLCSIMIAGLSNLMTTSAIRFNLPKLSSKVIRNTDEIYGYGGIYSHPVMQEKRQDLPADTPASNFICTHRVEGCRNGGKFAVFQCGDQECACVCPEEVTELSARLHNFKKFLARTGGVEKRLAMKSYL